MGDEIPPLMYGRNVLGPLGVAKARVDSLFDQRQLTGSEQLRHQTPVINQILIDLSELVECFYSIEWVPNDSNSGNRLFSLHMERLVEDGRHEVHQLGREDQRTVHETRRFRTVNDEILLPVGVRGHRAANGQVVIDYLADEFQKLAATTSDIISFINSDESKERGTVLLSWESIHGMCVDLCRSCRWHNIRLKQQQVTTEPVSGHIETTEQLPDTRDANGCFNS